MIEGVALVAGQGLAVGEVDVTVEVGDHILHVGAGDAAEQLAVEGVFNIPVRGGLRRRMGISLSSRQEGLDHHLLDDGAAGLIGRTVQLAAFDIEVLGSRCLCPAPFRTRHHHRRRHSRRRRRRKRCRRRWLGLGIDLCVDHDRGRDVTLTPGMLMLWPGG